jgi:hypothetical protein
LVPARFDVFVAALGAIVNNKLAGLVDPFAVFVESLCHNMTLPQKSSRVKRVFKQDLLIRILKKLG